MSLEDFIAATLEMAERVLAKPSSIKQTPCTGGYDGSKKS